MAAWDNAPVVDEAQPAWESAPTVEQPAPSTQDTIQNALGLAQEVYLRSVAPGFAFVPDVLKQGLISPETATKAVSYLPPVKIAELALGKEKAAPGERMAGEILSGFTSPENLALMATPGIAAKLGTGIKFSELLRPSTLREIAFGKPTQPMMTPEEVGKSLGRTWRSTKEVIPSATEKGQVQENVPIQREGVAPRPAVPTDYAQVRERGGEPAGRGYSVRPTAQAKEVNPEAIKAPAVKDKFGKVIPLQPGEIHATVMTAGDTAGYITNSGEFLNFEQAAGRARAQPPTPIPTVPKTEQPIQAAIKFPDGTVFSGRHHGEVFAKAEKAGYSVSNRDAFEDGFIQGGKFLTRKENYFANRFSDTAASPVPKAESATTATTQPKIISTAVNTPEGVKTGAFNQPHEEIVKGAPEEQRGFIVRDANGERFVGREEAAGVAKAAGQVKPENAGTTELHSQELAPAAGEGVSAVPQPKEAAETPTVIPKSSSPQHIKEWIGEGTIGGNLNNAGNPLKLYHGTKAEFESFRPSEGGAVGPGIYLSKEPKLASVFAGEKEGARVLQVYARGKYLKIPYGEMHNAAEWNARARAEGYNGLDTGLGELVVFDPKDIVTATGKPVAQAETSGISAAPPTEPPSPPPLPEPEKPFSITSIKNAQVDQERIARGLPSATETGRKTFGNAWDQATAKIDADPNYVDTLLNELRGKPRALNDTEDAALLHRQVDLQNQFAKAAEEVNRAAATGDEGLMAENKVRLSALSDQLLDLYNIGKSSGTETARGLAMRKALAAEDFSLANMMTQERASLGGKPLTPEQEAGVRARHEKIRSAQIAYDAYETSPRAEAYRRRLRSLVEQYKAGTPPERGRRLTPDREMLQLKADLEQAKTDHWQSLQKNRMAQRSGFDKARDTFAKWRRAFVLSSPNTLAKLTSAAVERLTFTPTEEAIGGLISKIPGISEVARRAPIEGGFSAKAEARALTEGFTQGMKDSWSLLKGGRSAIDIQYGPQHVLPKEAVDFVGQVHGALKTVPRQAAFERAFQKLAEAGIAKGEDVTDPLIQTRYGIEAYKEANREIFLQNNRLISLYRQMLARLEAPDKETGLVPLSSRVASTAARVLFPIVKVPTNIVAETMQYATGTVTGSLRLANAFRRGIETLKPEQAELIMRDLKKGSLGSTVMLLGYLNADKVGGYYQKGQRRSPQDVKAGHIKVFGVDIPTYLIHNPLLETLQIGATIRRVAESKLRKKDVAPQGIGSGFLAGALGLTEEVPFVREMFDSFPKLFTATERPQFLGEFAKGLFIPQAVQWAALQLDKRNGDPVKRDAQTFLQHLQSGIPGLRQNVPEKRPRSGVTQPFAQ